MLLWKALYGTVWLAFFSIVLLPRWMGAYIGFPIQGLLGPAMLFVTLSNARRLASMPVPSRLKRISKVIAGFAVFQVVFGAALGVVMHFFPGIPYIAPVLRGVHIAPQTQHLCFPVSNVLIQHSCHIERMAGSCA